MRYEIGEGEAAQLASVTSKTGAAGFKVEAGGELLDVTVLSHVPPYLVSLGGRVIEVRLAENRTLGRGSPGAFDAQIWDDQAGLVQLELRREHLLLGSDPTEATANNSRLKSPIPGRILRVLVSNGDTVEKGQPLLVVEAMKMENELFAPSAGQVVELQVKVGDAVEAQAPLLRVQPSDEAL